MAEVLVLVDHADVSVRKTTLELLTVARRLGEPSAVFVGTLGDEAATVLRQYGAAKVYTVDPSVVEDWLVAPKAEVLAELVAQVAPQLLAEPGFGPLTGQARRRDCQHRALQQRRQARPCRWRRTDSG